MSATVDRRPAAVAQLERERDALERALLRLLRATGSEVVDRHDLRLSLGLDTSALASTPRPLTTGVHVRSRFLAGSELTDLEVFDAHSLVGGAARGRLRPAAGRGRVPGRVMDGLRHAYWAVRFWADGEVMPDRVRASLIATLIGITLLHIALTGPWVGAIGRAVIGGMR
jgi:hypothetical protein